MQKRPEPEATLEIITWFENTPEMGVTPTHSLPPPRYDFLDTGQYRGGITDVEQV